MSDFMTLGFIITLFYLLVRFARQEQIQDVYEAVVIDIESRLDWARTRRNYPFGMESQMAISKIFLTGPRQLWLENRWAQAYKTALKSRKHSIKLSEFIARLCLM